MFKQRTFKYVGTEGMLTRGDYGVRVEGGHNTPEAPAHISTFDPDFGDQIIGSISTLLASGEWEEITE